MSWGPTLALLLWPVVCLGLEFGWTASMHNWPFTAALYTVPHLRDVPSLFQGQDYHWALFCTGTIITESHVLTTADCVYRKHYQDRTVIEDEPWFWVRIKVGSAYAFIQRNFQKFENIESQERTVKRIYVPELEDLEATFDHPNITENSYTMGGNTYYYLDFSIIELNEPLQWNRFVQPVIFDTKEFNKDTEYEYLVWKRSLDSDADWIADCHMAGWGYDTSYEKKLLPNIPRLMWSRMRYLPKLQCDLALCTNCTLCENRTVPELEADRYWCFSSYISGETCPGDQGAPLFCPWFGYKNRAGETEGAILGLLSGIPGNCNKESLPGKYIAIWYSYKFIERIVDMGKWPPPPLHVKDPDWR